LKDLGFEHLSTSFNLTSKQLGPTWVVLTSRRQLLYGQFAQTTWDESNGQKESVAGIAVKRGDLCPLMCVAASCHGGIVCNHVCNIVLLEVAKYLECGIMTG
jgi:hypothetical protein